MPDRLLSRLGFHYFPDSFHYRESDLNTWLPILLKLHARWLTLVAPADRAIPEFFLHGLLESGIQPVLHLPLDFTQPVDKKTLFLLFEEYSRWGVKYIALFDRPNLRESWLETTWAQPDLVERFLDHYLPLAEVLVLNNLVPVFPPLEPGGDYWDTAFLKAALQGILRRGYTSLCEVLALGAYAWPDNRPLNWGAGGPERWPSAHPYEAGLQSENQLGFRIFDWYLAISRAVLGRPLPVLLLATGSRPGDCSDTFTPAIDLSTHTRINLILAQWMLLDMEVTEPIGLDPIPPEVLACNFWLLSAAQHSPFRAHAWFQPDGQHLPIVSTLQQWLERHHPQNTVLEDNPADPVQTNPLPSISHYLLMPTFDWGVTDWHLEVVQPFVKKYKPTVGFSIEEASQASRVTILGDPDCYPKEIEEVLISAGCIIEWISGTGIEIASKLATL